MTIPMYAWGTHRESLPLEVMAFVVDGETRGDLVDAARHRVRLDQAPLWRSAVLLVRVTVPEVEGVADPSAVTVMVASTATRSRTPVPLVHSGNGTWSGDVRLLRSQLAGSVDLFGDVTARPDGRVRLVGRTDGWSVIVDAGSAPEPAGAPPFPITWVDFTSDKAPALARRVPDAPAVMDAGLPMLYLNDGVEGLRGLLHADTARGERRRARDLLGSEVARTAFTALLRSAAAEAVASEGEVPESGLHRQVLTAVARFLPTAADPEELCRRISATAGAPPEVAALWTELDAAVARLCRAPDAVAALAKESRNA